jgi:hypothetical protein
MIKFINSQGNTGKLLQIKRLQVVEAGLWGWLLSEGCLCAVVAGAAF